MYAGQEASSPISAYATYAPTRNTAPWARLSTSIIPNTSDSPDASRNSRQPIASPLSTLMRLVSNHSGMGSGCG